MAQTVNARSAPQPLPQRSLCATAHACTHRNYSPSLVYLKLSWAWAGTELSYLSLRRRMLAKMKVKIFVYINFATSKKKAINQSSAESSSSWVRDSKKKKGGNIEGGEEARGYWRMQQPLQNLSEEEHKLSSVASLCACCRYPVKELRQA